MHGHWLLARLARRGLERSDGSRARAALAESLTPARIAPEVTYLRAPGRTSYERPYGLAWLLQLALELHEWAADASTTTASTAEVRAQAEAWQTALAPLVAASRQQLASWLPKLAYPIRIGEHDQTAFSFGLALDWARGTGDGEMATLLERTTLRLYGRRPQLPRSPTSLGQDFLSPCIAEADLMRRVMPPRSSRNGSPTSAASAARRLRRLAACRFGHDRADPKLAHLDGLNLSRAWMLEGIAAGLPAADTRRPALLAAASAHRAAALPRSPVNIRRRPLAGQLRDLPGDRTRAWIPWHSLDAWRGGMRVARLAFVAATLLVALDRASASAQQVASSSAIATDPREVSVQTLIGRLDLEKYKATIRSLTAFGDRRQGTERNRKAVDWIEAQLRSYGCATERLQYAYRAPSPPAAAPPGAAAAAEGKSFEPVLGSGEVRLGPGGSRYRGIQRRTGVNTDPDAQPDPVLRG